MPSATSSKAKRARTSLSSPSEARHHSRPHQNSMPWPNLSAPNWQEQPCFSRYWQHYRYVMSWSRMQSRHYRQAHTFYDRSQMMMSQVPHPSSYRNQGNRHNNHRNRGHSATNSNRCHNQDNVRVDLHDQSQRAGTSGDFYEGKDDTVHEDTISDDIDIAMDSDLLEDEDDTDSEDFEMHVTKEMVDFFTKSHRHRLARDAARADREEKAKEEGPRIDLATASIQKTKADVSGKAPTERPGVRRTAEMKKLYGNNAAMIHGMETALQMTFDRNCDVQRPTLWPIMPFNIPVKPTADPI